MVIRVDSPSAGESGTRGQAGGLQEVASLHSDRSTLQAAREPKVRLSLPGLQKEMGIYRNCIE